MLSTKCDIVLITCFTDLFKWVIIVIIVRDIRDKQNCIDEQKNYIFIRSRG